MKTCLFRSALVTFTTLVLTGGLPAQTATPGLEFPAASPGATIKQRVGITDIEVVYSRPSMRERRIFGGLVPYGEVWRTGANSATRISFSTPVKVQGAALEAGTYEFYTIPGQSEWMLIFQKLPENASWGAYAYDPKRDTARVTAKPEALAAPVETFTIGLNDLRDTSATLNLFWENTRVPAKIEIDTVGMLKPQIEAVMASDAAKKPYFAAAMFYYENNVDLQKAAEWIDAAVKEQPDAFWMIYRQGLILEKAGDKAGAIAAAKQSLELTAKQSGQIKDEYTRLNNALLARLK
jgi:hypothetical protein